MNTERISFFASVIGLVLSISGLFLPWGKEKWLPWMGELNYLLGVELTLGQFALAGCIFAAVSLLLYRTRNQRYALAFVLLGGLITMFCSLVWIANPGALVPKGYLFLYEVLYGTYITFFGAVLTSVGAISSLSRL